MLQDESERNKVGRKEPLELADRKCSAGSITPHLSNWEAVI